MKEKRWEDKKQLQDYCNYLHQFSFPTIKNSEQLFISFSQAVSSEKEILRKKLIEMYLPAVVQFILKKYNYSYDINPVFDVDDVIQEGNLLLIKAIDSYNPNKGKFLPYLYQIMKFELYYANGLAGSAVNFSHICTKAYKKVKKMIMLGYTDEEIRKTCGISSKTLSLLKPFLLESISYKQWYETVEKKENEESTDVSYLVFEDRNILKLLEQDNILIRNETIKQVLSNMSELNQQLLMNKFHMTEERTIRICHIKHNLSCSPSNIYKKYYQMLKDLAKNEDLKRVYKRVDTNYVNNFTEKTYYLQ